VPLTVFHEVDNTLFSANSSTFLGDIYRRLGLVNIADAVPDEFASGYVQLSEEYLFSQDPDLIFLGDAGFGENSATVRARPGWDALSAVRHGAVFELDGDIAGRWGPRTVTLVEEIVAAIKAAS
jgi:iron complex transport system substrate-binding protein